jgi:hypothetical protein
MPLLSLLYVFCSFKLPLTPTEINHKEEREKGNEKTKKERIKMIERK